MAAPRRGVVLVAALVVLCIGFADAGCSSHRNCPSKANAYTYCIGGECSYKCRAGWSDCDNNIIKNGCEVNTDTDVMRCGNCGRQCIPYSADTMDLTCVKGECVYTCHQGLSDCNDWLRDGCESRLPYNNDLRFCGACDTPCLMSLPNADSACILGQCHYTCHSGFGNCDNNWTNGCERDLTKDVNHCNTCNNKCANTLVGGEPTCSARKCGEQCKKGSTYDYSMKKCGCCECQMYFVHTRMAVLALELSCGCAALLLFCWRLRRTVVVLLEVEAEELELVMSRFSADLGILHSASLNARPPYRISIARFSFCMLASSKWSSFRKFTTSYSNEKYNGAGALRAPDLF